jgi:hypothetical protein
MPHDPDDPRTAGSADLPGTPLQADLERASDADGANLAVEHDLVHHIVVDIVIAVPVAIAVLVGMVALAVSIDGAALEAPLLMAVAIGTLVGVFFGAWAGFVSTAHSFEELDRMYGHTPQH